MPLHLWFDTILSLKKPSVKVFIVGGFVRDLLLNRTKTDIDLTVTSGALSLAQAFAKKIKGVYVLLDQEHGCARVVKKIDDIAYTVDFSDFRSKTLKGDLGLRDFTINSLTVEITKTLSTDNINEGITDFNGALKDLNKGIIRMNDLCVFKDDPLRLMRAFSLSAQLGFAIERSTLAQINKDSSLINQSAAERVREELFKILESPRASETLELMDKIGLLDRVIPQLACMKGVLQGGFHHLDVWQHSLLVVREVEALIALFQENQGVKQLLEQEIGGSHSRGALLKLACLLHDIGKPDTKKLEGDRFTFHTHEHVGAAIVRHVCRQLRVTVKERYFLEDLVKLHLRPGYLSNAQVPSEKSMYRFMRDSKSEAVSLALLAMADQAATKGPLATQEKLLHHRAICEDIIKRSFAPPKESIPKARLLTGTDLIKKLKLKPSPLFATIIEAVEEAKALGKIKTKAEALDLARGMIKG